MSKKQNFQCGLCKRMTSPSRRGSYSTAKGSQMYFCHGPNVKQDCYVMVAKDPQLRAQLTGKEVAAQK